jgi:hypothetical protein
MMAILHQKEFLPSAKQERKEIERLAAVIAAARV